MRFWGDGIRRENEGGLSGPFTKQRTFLFRNEGIKTISNKITMLLSVTAYLKSLHCRLSIVLCVLHTLTSHIL